MGSVEDRTYWARSRIQTHISGHFGSSVLTITLPTQIAQNRWTDWAAATVGPKSATRRRDNVVLFTNQSLAQRWQAIHSSKLGDHHWLNGGHPASKTQDPYGAHMGYKMELMVFANRIHVNSIWATHIGNIWFGQTGSMWVPPKGQQLCDVWCG